MVNFSWFSVLTLLVLGDLEKQEITNPLTHLFFPVQYLCGRGEGTLLLSELPGG